MSAPIVVYTCVTHRYDEVPPVLSAEKGVDFLCFTDRPERVGAGWRALPLQSPRRLQSGHDVNRYHKCFPQRFLQDARFSVYLDGNVQYRASFGSLVDCVRSSGVALAAYSHPDGRTMEQESQACIEFGKFDAHDMAKKDEQLRAYRRYGFPTSKVVTANYLLVRDHGHPSLDVAMSLWWSQLFEFTKRDQLSLNYALWRTGVPWAYLDRDFGVPERHLMRVVHRRSFRQRLKRAVLRRWNGIHERGPLRR